jgi:hypothetical protein
LGGLVPWSAGVGLPGWFVGVLWWWVGPGGAGDVDLAVGDGDGPFAGVEVEVVAAAEQGEVVDGGVAAVDPGL